MQSYTIIFNLTKFAGNNCATVVPSADNAPRDAFSIRPDIGRLLRDFDQLFAVGVQDSRLGDESQIAVFAVDNRQHPCIILLESRQHTLNLFVLQDFVGRLNHVVRNGTAVLLMLEHILAQVVQLHHAQQVAEIVDDGEYVAAR